jgi:3-carboxymuconate cyclase
MHVFIGPFAVAILLTLAGCGGQTGATGSSSGGSSTSSSSSSGSSSSSSSSSSASSSSSSSSSSGEGSLSLIAGGRYDLAAVEIDLTTHAFGRVRNLAGTGAGAFGVLAPDQRNLYFTFYSGSVQQLDSLSARVESSANSGGTGAAHVAVSPSGRELAVANYDSGHVAIYALNGDGTINRQINLYRPAGNKAHWIGWSRRSGYLYTVVLEIGRVFGFRPDGAGGYAAPFTALDLGTQVNPRHMDFHPTLAKVYVLNEKAGTLTYARMEDDGTLTEEGSVSTLPDGFTAYNQTAHIQVAADGRTLYTSNRGHNSVAVFQLNDQGIPQRIQLIGSEGDIPRTFKLFDAHRLLVVANQGSSELSLFAVLPDGRLEFTGEKAYVDTPVFVDGTTGLRFGEGLNNGS